MRRLYIPRNLTVVCVCPVFSCQIIDRGIALRKNLCLPQSHTASTVIHGIQEGEVYAFTVSCVAEVEGALRHVRKLRDDFTAYRYHFRGRCYRQYGHLALIGVSWCRSGTALNIRVILGFAGPRKYPPDSVSMYRVSRSSLKQLEPMHVLVVLSVGGR